MSDDSGFVEVGGVRLEVKTVGEHSTADPAIILLHEGLGCVALWRDFPDKLHNETGLQVVSYSRQGYGHSDPCELPRPVSYMHDEGNRVLPALLQKLQISNPILIGHSDGASIATIYAGDKEQRKVRALILMAPHFFVEEVSVESIRKARQAYRKTNLRDRLAKYHGNNVDCAFLGWNGAWLNTEFLDWNIQPDLARTDCPILAIQGADDQYGTLAQISCIRELAKGPVQTRTLGQCGHAPHLDQPILTLATITQFIAGL